MAQTLTNDGIIDALRRVVERCGDGIRMFDFVRETGISQTIVEKRFGGWMKLRVAAGLRGRGDGRRKMSAELLVWDLRRFADEVGPQITLSEFCRLARISQTPVIQYFGNWSNLRRAAGLPRRDYKRPFISDEELLWELHRMIRELHRIPLARDFREHCRYSYDTYLVRFGRKKDLKLRLRMYLDRIAARWEYDEYVKSRPEVPEGTPMAERPGFMPPQSSD